MNSANQQLALKLATSGPLRLPQPFLPAQVTEQLSPTLKSEVLDAMRADLEDAAGNLAVHILGAVLDATSKNGNGSALLAQIMGSKWLIKGQRRTRGLAASDLETGRRNPARFGSACARMSGQFTAEETEGRTKRRMMWNSTQ